MIVVDDWLFLLPSEFLLCIVFVCVYLFVLCCM